MIPPQTGWVVLAQWQSVPHVWGSPGFDPRSGLVFLFLQWCRTPTLSRDRIRRGVPRVVAKAHDFTG